MVKVSKVSDHLGGFQQLCLVSVDINLWASFLCFLISISISLVWCDFVTIIFYLDLNTKIKISILARKKCNIGYRMYQDLQGHG